MLRLILLVFIASLVSCANVDSRKEPVQPPETVLKDFNSFWSYWNKEVRLSANYKAYNAKGDSLSKIDFLQQLATGDFVALKLKGESLQYQLYPITATALPDISSAVVGEAKRFIDYYSMLGKPLPDFNFTDLNGNVYNKTTCKGKTVVIKCWYIHCTKCVQEMPELNEMVDTFENNKNVVFVSLAFDTPEQLREFLTKREFKYAVVPDKQTYLLDTLKITNYPTHIIVNGESGIMTNVVDEVRDLESALNIVKLNV